MAQWFLTAIRVHGELQVMIGQAPERANLVEGKTYSGKDFGINAELPVIKIFCEKSAKLLDTMKFLETEWACDETATDARNAFALECMKAGIISASFEIPNLEGAEL
jgi:hypothetical protein